MCDAKFWSYDEQWCIECTQEGDSIEFTFSEFLTSDKYLDIFKRAWEWPDLKVRITKGMKRDRCESDRPWYTICQLERMLDEVEPLLNHRV